jgi:hypothetical protein
MPLVTFLLRFNHCFFNDTSLKSIIGGIIQERHFLTHHEGRQQLRWWTETAGNSATNSFRHKHSSVLPNLRADSVVETFLAVCMAFLTNHN